MRQERNFILQSVLCVLLFTTTLVVDTRRLYRILQ